MRAKLLPVDSAGVDVTGPNRDALPPDEGTSITSDTGAFALLPEWVLLSEVSDRAIRLYCVFARHADKQSSQCFPGRKRLAAMLRTSVATVDRAVKELEDIGALSKQERRRADGSQTSNDWTIHRVIRGGGASPVRRGGASPVEPQERESEGTRENTRAISESPSLVADPLEEEFERWWKNYPRRTAKVNARKAYLARRREGIEPKDLLAAARRYADDRHGEPDKFTLHPATFLGPGERWRDFLPADGAEDEYDDPGRSFTDELRLSAAAERRAK